MHVHSEWTLHHLGCDHTGWRCTRCGHDHGTARLGGPRCCERCDYTVLAPLWSLPTPATLAERNTP